MGKVIRPSNKPKQKVKFRKKTQYKRKLAANTNKSEDESVVVTYLKKLSHSFGTNSSCGKLKKKYSKIKPIQRNESLKRKISEDDQIEQVALELFDTKEIKNLKKIKLDHQYDETPIKPISTIANRKYAYTRMNDRLKFEERTLTDLFCLDESKCSYECSLYTDWLFHICDEIALEGLEGITIEALWTRLKNLSDRPVVIIGKEEFWWRLICYVKHVECHILPVARNKLIVHDRNLYFDDDSGVIVEAFVNYEDIYPYLMHNTGGVRGSSSMFLQRMDNTEIIKKLSLEKVLDVYGMRLIVVADQKLRNKALFNEITDPNVELTDAEYGMLERVGRSRRHGELTQGNISIQSIIKDSKSIFHVRKILEKSFLMKKQFFLLRSFGASQNKTGKLLHLTRFYSKYKSKALVVTEQVVNVLKQSPGHQMEYAEFRKYFGKPLGGLRKLMKQSEFQRYVKTGVYCLYRHLYPSATTAEWKCKSKDREKTLKLLQLINPTMNVIGSWYPAEQNSDDESADEEESGNKIINSEFLKEVFLFIFSKGREGVSVQDIEKKCELDFYSVRTAVRKLQAKNVIDCVKNDCGRQRQIQYFARCFHATDISINPVPKPMKLPASVLNRVLRAQVSCQDQIPIPSESPKKNEPSNRQIAIIDVGLQSTFECKAFLRDVHLLAVDTVVKQFPFICSYRTILPLFSSINVKTVCDDFSRKYGKKFSKFLLSKNVLVETYSENILIKLLLLKSLLNETPIDSSEIMKTVESVTSNVEQPMDQMPNFSPVRSDITLKVTNTMAKDVLLGTNPTVVFEERSDGIETTVLMSTLPKRYVLNCNCYTSRDKSVSLTALSRTNIILDVLNREKAICDSYKFLHIIDEIEKTKSKGKTPHGKMDKKSLIRILLRLIREGYIKVFKLMMTGCDNTKLQWLICHPSADLNNTTIKNAYEQMKMKFFIGTDKKIPPAKCIEVLKCADASPFTSSDVIASIRELKELSNAWRTIKYKCNRSYGKTLGYQPKFVRMQILHEMLFYLVYDYQHVEKLSRQDVSEVLQHFTPSEIAELPPIYSKEINWKMFVAPLPVHKNWPLGWALLCDILLRLPLSLFVKLFNVTHESPEIIEYLQHPIKKHFLVKYLPAEFRNVLLFRKKYLSCTIEILYRLCFIGLLQLGPQRFGERDQVFIYLNTNTTLYDTSTSGPSYHKVTPKSYKSLSFHFFSMTDVEEYWCQLWTISMNTPLGQRNVMEGKCITIEQPTSKPALLEAIKARTPDSALINDTGIVPGDKQGAAGFDSSMWVHIKRNWLWAAKAFCTNKRVVKRNEPNMRKDKIENIKPLPIRYNELMADRKIYLYPTEESNKSQKTKSKKVHSPNPIVKKKTITRKMKVRPKKHTKKYDAKDKMIIKKLGCARKVQWIKKEDRILRLCKAASCFLWTNSTKQMVPYVVIRDVLHQLCPESKNKASGACRRRIKFLMNTDPIMKEVGQNAGNMMNLFKISKYYSSIVYALNHSSTEDKINESQLNTAFIYLVSYMYENIKVTEMVLQGYVVTLDYFSPLHVSTYRSILIPEDVEVIFYWKPTSEVEIKRDVLKSVIHSSLASLKFNPSWAYQLFKIYQKFKDDSIHSAVSEMKSQQMISYKKRSATTDIKNVGHTPFQLSNLYVYMQSTTYSKLTFYTIYQNFAEMVGEKSNYIDVDSTTTSYRYGRLIANNEVASLWDRVVLFFDVPETAFVLNPYIQDHSELIKELAVRYKSSLEQKKKQREDCEMLLSNYSSSNQTDTCQTVAVSNNSIMQSYKGFRNTIARLMLAIPCLCNKEIHNNFSSFMESRSEIEINNYLSSFVDILRIVAIGLFNTASQATRDLKTYINKFGRTRITKPIESLSAELELKLNKIVYIIKEFLRAHEIADIKACFDITEVDEIVSNQSFPKDLDQWINAVTWVQVDADESTCQNHYNFFKYMKTKDAKSSDTNLQEQVDNEIPDIPDIMKGMMKMSYKNTKRDVPYITDLVSLLTKKFTEPNTDEESIEEFRSHFIAQYPILEAFVIEDLNGFKDNRVIKNAMDTKKKNEIQEYVQRYCIRGKINTAAMYDKIRELGGDDSDKCLTDKIIDYVHEKQEFGASGVQLLKQFGPLVTNLNLTAILKTITDTNVFLRTGIEEITFVHYKFESVWLIETFLLSPYEKQMLQTFSKEDLQKLKESIEARIQPTDQLQVIVMPWIRVDGSLNIALFEKWLTMVLSHCLDYPNIPMTHLCKKFNFLKPVDLYFLVETLQDLNCLKVNTYERARLSLFSTNHTTVERLATVFDRFEDMYIETYYFSMTCMGFYLNKDDFEIV